MYMGHFHVLISWKLSWEIYPITTLCLNGTLPCVDFMEVIMGDILYNHTVFEWDTSIC